MLAVAVGGHRPQQRLGDHLHGALEGLQHDVAGEPVGDDDVDGVGRDVAPFDVADEVDALGRLEQLEGLFAQRVALAGLLADRQQANTRLGDGEAVVGEDRAHLGELHEPLRLHVGVGAGVEEDRGRRAGHGDGGGDRRALDALDAAHPQQRRGHRGAGVAGGDHRRCLLVADGLGRTHQRRVLLPAHAAGGVLVHGDDLGRLDQRQVTAIREVGRTDQDDRYSLGSGALGALDDLAGCTVAAHGVDRDRQHERPDHRRVMRASERQRGSGQQRPAWPGNAMIRC